MTAADTKPAEVHVLTTDELMGLLHEAAAEDLRIGEAQRAGLHTATGTAMKVLMRHQDAGKRQWGLLYPEGELQPYASEAQVRYGSWSEREFDHRIVSRDGDGPWMCSYEIEVEVTGRACPVLDVAAEWDPKTVAVFCAEWLRDVTGARPWALTLMAEAGMALLGPTTTAQEGQS